MGAGAPVFVRATVEVQVGDGGAGVSHERAEAVRRRLLEHLGSPPFASALDPSIFLAGVLISPAERLTIRYDPRQVVVTQESLESIARVEQVAPVVWHEVNERFELRHRVRQARIRYLLMWPARSAADAQARILNLGLFEERPRVRQVFGEPPRSRSYTVVVGSEEHPVRYHLCGASAVAETGAGEVPSPGDNIQIPWGILLDIDCRRVFPAGTAGTLKQAELRGLIRASWARSLESARALADLL
jgi:hypothetical protein